MMHELLAPETDRIERRKVVKPPDTKVIERRVPEGFEEDTSNFMEFFNAIGSQGA